MSAIRACQRARHRFTFLIASTRAGVAKAYRVDGAGAVHATGTLTNRAAFGGAWVYSDQTEYLASWWPQGAGSGVLGRRVSEQGTLLDTADITFVPNVAEPGAAVWNGTHYFFVWSQATDLLGAQVSSSGAMVGSPVRITSRSAAPTNAYRSTYGCVSWDGANHLVVWPSIRATSANFTGRAYRPTATCSIRAGS